MNTSFPSVLEFLLGRSDMTALWRAKLSRKTHTLCNFPWAAQVDTSQGSVYVRDILKQPDFQDVLGKRLSAGFGSSSYCVVRSIDQDYHANVEIGYVIIQFVPISTHVTEEFIPV
jgi:hypothetical protein